MAKVKVESALNLKEMKETLRFNILNNKFLQERGKKPISYNIIGPAGIGKTTMVKDLANEMSLQMVKINLAQIDEVGHLLGFPVKKFEIVKDELNKWVQESVLTKYMELGWEPSGKSEMTYAAPEWSQNLREGGILFLDDFTRKI